MAEMKVGRVIHYYDKLGVAIVELSGSLAVGDKIRFERGGEELFDQIVESIQMEHEKLELAKSGDAVGLKVSEPVKEGSDVFKF